MDSNVPKLPYDSYFKFTHAVKATIVEATVLEQEGNWDKASKKLESTRKEIELILEKADENASDRRDKFLNAVTESIAEVVELSNQILEHIALCNEKLSSYVDTVAPPSYEEAMSTVSSNGSASDRRDDQERWSTTNSLSYNELGAVLENLKAETQSQSAQMIYSCENVTLYYISPSGAVSLSSGPETVRIFEIEDGSSNSIPKYYLQVYLFVYPLVPKVSPCIRTEFGAIVLPNVNDAEVDQADVKSIGLMIPKEQEDDFIACLENILQTKIVYLDTKQPESVSSKISDGIKSGAECVSKFLIDAAQGAGDFMDGNTPKLIDKMNPATRNRRISPCVSNGIRIARDVTAITAGVTGFVASRVGAATYSLGQFLAPHIREKGSKLISNVTGVNENQATEKIDALLNVTAGAVEGVGTVYQSLEESARIFGRSLSNNTVHIVKHKYGRPAAEFTQDTFEVVSNGVEIGTRLRFFKPSNMAKSTAKGVVLSSKRDAPGSANKSEPNNSGDDRDAMKKPSTSGVVQNGDHSSEKSGELAKTDASKETASQSSNDYSSLASSLAWDSGHFGTLQPSTLGINTTEPQMTQSTPVEKPLDYAQDLLL